MHKIKDIVKKVGESHDPIKIKKLGCLVEELILESDCPDKYEHELYILANGYHFNHEKMDEALEKIGAKWCVEEVCSIMKSLGITFVGEYSEVTDFDKCYVMNMLHSDFYPLISDSSTMAKFSEKYIKDEDYPIKGGKPFAEWSHKKKLKEEMRFI